MSKRTKHLIQYTIALVILMQVLGVTGFGKVFFFAVAGAMLNDLYMKRED